MVSFRKLHSHLKLLSHNKLKGTRTESGFKRAFATLFGQDVETFIGTMFLNVDQLEKKLDKEEFQEIGSMASFKVLEKQFQMFIKSRMYLDDEFVETGLQPRRNQSVVRQPTAFKSERPRISKQRFASQVDVNNDLSKPVTTHYLPKERESAVAKPHHMIAPGSSRSQSTTNGSKPKPRINNQKSRNWPASKSSCVTTTTVPIAEHSRNSSSFSDSKHFVCSTCQKCVFNANHDSCITKFLNEVNSRAKVPSNKTTKRYIPVEQTSFAKKPERQIPKRHRSSIKKTSVWVPTGKIFTSSTTKVDSEPTNGSNDDITNQYECKQTLDVSAGTLNIHAGTSLNPTKEGLRVWLLKRLISEKPWLQEFHL
ncbi:hypothetical protein Tco_0894963 [Tanacetum coccineum]|uniref:Uncharacterized protein n=1 Tax=Tanacetum coccineum TaxID=301880 RepID=A0ABQ5CD65_9ASTR